MTAFFLAFLGIALVLLGGREALRVARLAARTGATAVLLVACVAAVVAGFSLAAWIATSFVDALGEGWRLAMVAGALAVAALEVLLLRAPPVPREPTRSLGAVTLVLMSSIVADASGLVVLALVLATGQTLFAAGGAMLGAIAVLGAAIMAAADWEKLPLRMLRLLVGSGLLILAIAVSGLAYMAPN